MNDIDKVDTKVIKQEKKLLSSTIRNLAVCGYTHEEIAEIVEVSPLTLKKRFEHELKYAKKKANGRVVGALLKNAVENENVTAQIWWTKTQLGWKETQQIESVNYHYVDTPPMESRAEWEKRNTIDVTPKKED